MKITVIENETCRLCGSAENVLCTDWENGDIQPVALCKACRMEVQAKWEAAESTKTEESEGALPSLAQAIADEAANLTEEAFSEKYLQDVFDRVVFEYIRGYGRIELDGTAFAMISLMLENASEETIREHAEGLLEKGLIYRVPGRTGWYGADYPFADDV